MTGTQINYYFLCKRKLWLFVNRVDMEQNSDVVAMGRFISDSTYKREEHEVLVTDGDDSIVLDFFDAKSKIIHEVKKSDSMEDVHIWQVKFYISILEKKGITGVRGEIDYPKLRQKIEVNLSDSDREELGRIRDDINNIISSEKAPPVINKPFCKKCAYYDLCYI